MELALAVVFWFLFYFDPLVLLVDSLEMLLLIMGGTEIKILIDAIALGLLLAANAHGYGKGHLLLIIIVELKDILDQHSSSIIEQIVMHQPGPLDLVVVDID